MVIVILGVLSAVALPKFVDLKSDAAQAAVNGAAGAVNAAMAINYAAFKATGTTKGFALTGPSAVNTLITNGAITAWDSNQFTISSDADCSGRTTGASVAATLQSGADTSRTAAATVICTG